MIVFFSSLLGHYVPTCEFVQNDAPRIPAASAPYQKPGDGRIIVNPMAEPGEVIDRKL
jgi:hypothetical protein